MTTTTTKKSKDRCWEQKGYWTGIFTIMITHVSDAANRIIDVVRDADR